jgi:hypothetical protein
MADLARLIAKVALAVRGEVRLGADDFLESCQVWVRDFHPSASAAVAEEESVALRARRHSVLRP